MRGKGSRGLRWQACELECRISTKNVSTVQITPWDWGPWRCEEVDLGVRGRGVCSKRGRRSEMQASVRRSVPVPGCLLPPRSRRGRRSRSGGRLAIHTPSRSVVLASRKCLQGRSGQEDLLWEGIGFRPFQQSGFSTPLQEPVDLLEERRADLEALSAAYLEQRT